MSEGPRLIWSGGDSPRYRVERRRATAIMVGLLGFATGFALAAVLVLSNQGQHPLYYGAIGVGLGALALSWVAVARGAAPMPPEPIWSPSALRVLAESAGAPVSVFILAFYGLLAFGVLGNVVIPVLFR